MLDKHLCDRFRFFCRANKIKIAHGFLSPAITARDTDLQRVGMGGKSVSERFGLAGDLAKLKRT